MNVTRNQLFAIIGVILSALMTSTAFLTDTFGANMAHAIIGSAGFVNMILSGVTVILTGQGGQVKDVLAMPGIEKITVNADSNKTLATIAVDPTVDKISPTVASETQVAATAKGN